MPTRKSLFFSFLDRYAGLIISVGSSMVIARLLTPTEIGVYSVTMVLLAFASTVRDMGAGQYLVQERDLTTARIRAVWSVQLGLGFGLACVVALASYPVAIFYNEPRMRDIMLLVALNYLVNPFGSLTYAWLMREMHFQSVAMMRFLSSISGAFVAIWLAWKGYGPISLAFGSLASTVVNALVAVYFRPKSFPWLPGIHEIRHVLEFGSKLTFSTIIRTLESGAPELLIGKLQNLSAAGIYSRSNGLVQMFHRLVVDAVASVCLPWFAKQSREQGSFVDPFLKATAYVTAIGWSFCLVLICLAHPIVRVLYGDQWDQSVDLTRLLAAAMLFTVPASLCGTALLSSGAVAAIGRVTGLSAIQGTALIALGASQGLMPMGLAIIAASAIAATLWLRAVSKHFGLALLGLLRFLHSSMLVALMATIGPAISLWMYGPYPASSAMPLVFGGITGLVGFLAGVIIFDHPLREEVQSVVAKIKSAFAPSSS
jgi:O-antigen/teichoic acid export membrane protein